jgi:hypothetical protein
MLIVISIGDVSTEFHLSIGYVGVVGVFVTNSVVVFLAKVIMKD